MLTDKSPTSTGVCVYTNTYPLINTPNILTTTISMRERHMIAKDFSRSGEREPSNSGTFVKLNVLDYKRAE